MTSSRSRTARLVAIAAVLVVTAGAALAGGRKRVVVLDFEGPKAERFHDDLVKMIKKSHTVVPTDKWNGTAEDMDAAKVTDKNVKKVAKKLKVDGVISGKIEKRRDEYIIRLKLREGKSGMLVGDGVETKAEGPRLDGSASKDIKDELIGAIDGLEANHGGGGASDDDGDADGKAAKKTAKKKAGGDDDDGDADGKVAKKTAKKKAGGDDDDDGGSAKHGAFSKKSASDDDGGDGKAKKSEPAGKKKKPADDDDDVAVALKTKKAAPPPDDDDGDRKAKKTAAKKKTSDDDGDDAPKKSSKKKKVARGDDDDGGGVTGGVDVVPPVGAKALSAANRAIDGSVGASFTARSLTFSYASALGNPPPSYSQKVPVGGVIVDVTLYPLALGHKRRPGDILNGLGFAVEFDRNFLSSQKQYLNQSSTAETASLATTEQHYAFGPVFRLALGDKALGVKVLFEHQDFQISQQLPADAQSGATVDIPNVSYNAFTPTLFAAIPVAPKINVDADAGVMIVTSAGSGAYELDSAMEYGRSKKLGFQMHAGADYLITSTVFARALVHFEQIGASFAADPTTMANSRDPSNTGTQSVFGAKDVYFGFAVTVGYLF